MARKLRLPLRQSLTDAKGEIQPSTLVSGNILMKSDGEVAATDISQAEFNALLSGNSIIGVWGENNYKQYFRAGGSTEYQDEGENVTTGWWRINQEGQFCSVWPPSEVEVCYKAQRQGANILWHTSEGRV